MPADERHEPDTPAAQALAWFVRLNDPGASAEQEAAFRYWLTQDPAHRQAYDEAQALWRKLERPARRAAAKAALVRPRRPLRPFWLAAAAAVGLLVAMVFGPQVLVDLRADYSTASGERRQATLADGSRVTLNGGSAMTVRMVPEGRRVELLTGEAFFDVAPDRDRPFVVAAGDIDVRVTGTAFNVRRLGAAVTVTVARGGVAVATAGGTARLGAGQSVRVDGGRFGPVQPGDLDDVLAWRDGRLVFYRERLADVAAEVERLSAGRTLIARRGVGDLAASGAVQANDRGASLAALESALGVGVLHLPGGITVLY